MTYSVIDLEVVARRVYRLAIIKRDNDDVLQLWDETEGAKKRTLQNEVRKPPEEGGFLEAMRAFKINPDCAVVIGDSPKRFNGADEEYVLFKSVDRAMANTWNFPTEMFQARFLTAGTHRIGVDVQRAGLLPGLDLRTLPEVEAGFAAQHVYRITARRTDKQDLVQVWDETDGAYLRWLLKEFRFVRGSRDSGP